MTYSDYTNHGKTWKFGWEDQYPSENDEDERWEKLSKEELREIYLQYNEDPIARYEREQAEKEALENE